MTKTFNPAKGEALGLNTEQRNHVCTRESDPARGVLESAARVEAMQRQHERQETIGSQRDVPAISKRQKEALAVARELGQRFRIEPGRRNQGRKERREIAPLTVDFDAER